MFPYIMYYVCIFFRKYHGLFIRICSNRALGPRCLLSSIYGDTMGIETDMMGSCDPLFRDENYRDEFLIRFNGDSYPLVMNNIAMV